VGVPLPGATGETVAVKVTDWPIIDGFCDEVTLEVVLAFLTTCGFPVSEPVPAIEVAVAAITGGDGVIANGQNRSRKCGHALRSAYLYQPGCRHRERNWFPWAFPAPGATGETVAVKVT